MPEELERDGLEQELADGRAALKAAHFLIAAACVEAGGSLTISDRTAIGIDLGGQIHEWHDPAANVTRLWYVAPPKGEASHEIGPQPFMLAQKLAETAADLEAERAAHQPGRPNAWCECECHDDPLDACIRELEIGTELMEDMT
jgi:hypothetical protein